jgi:integrase
MGLIPLAAELVDVLRQHLDVRAAEGWGSDAVLFPRTDGGRLRHVARAWIALLKRAGLKYRPFHCLRHTFASHALKAGIRPELVQKWLGHSTLTMTLNTYGHFIPDSVGDAADAEKLGNLLK